MGRERARPLRSSPDDPKRLPAGATRSLDDPFETSGSETLPPSVGSGRGGGGGADCREESSTSGRSPPVASGSLS